MRVLLVLTYFILISTNALSEELKSGLRIGLDFAPPGGRNGISVTYDELSTGKHAEINDYNDSIYLAYVGAPSYFFGGLGWNYRIGYNEFKLNTQAYRMTESSSRDGSGITTTRESDLGSEISGRSLYIVPLLFYHFLRDSFVSVILGVGLGINYGEINGNIYITDSFKRENRDEDCYNFLDNNGVDGSLSDVGLYCDLKKADVKGLGEAWSPSILIKAGNLGFEFGWVNANLRENDDIMWNINDGQSLLFYQFNFD